METLPLEILRDVFFFAVLQSNWFSGEGGKVESSHASIVTPLRISHVCRTWRNASISDGRVWSYLYIDFQSSDRVARRPKKRNIGELFDIWIARSNIALLNYGVNFDLRREYSGQEGIKCAEHIVTTLIEQRHRWGNVDFNWGWGIGGMGSDVQAFDVTNMPMLTSLRLRCKHYPCMTIDFSQASQLTKVEICGNFSISASAEPLRHLKERSRLAFRDGYNAANVIRTCQNFLASAPFLEELQLEFGSGRGLQTSLLLNEDRPIYPGLRRLKLISWSDSEAFIDNVTLPSLQSLCYNSNPLGGGEPLLHFLERSLPPLTYLEVDGLHAFEDTSIPCLRLLPSLEHLQATSVDVSTHFFRELTVQDDGTGNTICPALKALAFGDLACEGDLVACTEAVISMLESRAKITESFRRVWFSPLQEFTTTIEPSQLRQYDQETKKQLFSELRVGEILVPLSST